MEFGWINLFGGLMVALLILPNIVYAIRQMLEKDLEKEKHKKPKNQHRWLHITEQIGRYSCIVLMWLPLFIGRFVLPSAVLILLYIVGAAILILVYYLLWCLYFEQPLRKYALSLAILPAVLFLFCGIVLCHPALIVAAVLFGASHIYLTANG